MTSYSSPYAEYSLPNLTYSNKQWHTQEIFFGGGIQKIQLRTGDREKGDLGAVAP
jgi:hypothetical protein